MFPTAKHLEDSPVRPPGPPQPQVPRGCCRAAVRGTAPRAPRWAEGPGPPAPAPPPAEAASPSASSGPVSPAASRRSRRSRRAAPSSERQPARPPARRQQLGEEKRPRRRPRSNSAALPLLASRGAGLRHRRGGSPPAPPVPSPGDPLAPRRPLIDRLPSAVCRSKNLLAALPGPPGRRGVRAQTAPPSRPRWCGPLLGGPPAHRRFAKVPELGSWALTGAGRLLSVFARWDALDPQPHPATSAPHSRGHAARSAGMCGLCWSPAGCSTPAAPGAGAPHPPRLGS